MKLLEIKDEDIEELKKIFKRITNYNKINYGYDIRIDIKGEEVHFKLDGVRF